MGYTLIAVLAHSTVLEGPPLWIADSKLVALEQSISMIPITHPLYDAFVQHQTQVPGEDWSGFILTPSPLVATLTLLSERGAVAYVEADYSGGIGDQRCVVWRDGEIKLGPSEDRNAISKALRCLGVKRQLLRDEFEAVGLNRHRRNEDWLSSCS